MRATKRFRRFESSAVVERIRTLVEIMHLYAGWKQVDFATNTGISPSRLSHYLAGHYHPRVDTLAQVSERLGVSLDWLVFGVGGIFREESAGGVDSVLAATAVLNQVARQLTEAVAQGETSPVRSAVEQLITQRNLELASKVKTA